MEKINKYIAPYHWSLNGFYFERYIAPLRKILQEFQKSDSVLDVGCGDGRITSFIAQRVKDVRGIDNQEYPLKMARLIFDELKIDNVKFSTGDIRNLNFKNEYFDKVCCFDVIEHIPLSDVQKAIFEMQRVLKKGGALYLTTPNDRELAGRIFGHKLIDKHYYEYNISELKRMLKPFFNNLHIYGFYLPLLPKVGMYPYIFPFKGVFKYLIKLGEKFPNSSFILLVVGVK